MRPTERGSNDDGQGGNGRSTLSPEESVALVLLAIAGELNISRWTQLANQAGVRQSATRDHSTTTMRALIARMERDGIVLSDGRSFICHPPMRLRLLKSQASSPSFDALVRIAQGASSLRYGYEEEDLLGQQAFLSIARNDAIASSQLRELTRLDPHAAVGVCLDALDAMDTTWLHELAPAIRGELFEIALPHMEARTLSCDKLYDQVADDLSLLDGSPDAAALAFAGIAVLRGDLTTFRKLRDAPSWSHLAPWLTSAEASWVGDHELAAAILAAAPPPRQKDHRGVLSILSVVALRLHSPESPRLDKLLKWGSAKRSLFAHTFRSLGMMADKERGRRVVYDASRRDPDRLATAWTLVALGTLDDSRTSTFDSLMSQALREATVAFETGLVWLGEELVAALEVAIQREGYGPLPADVRAIVTREPSRRRIEGASRDGADDDANSERSTDTRLWTAGPPVVTASAHRAAWESSLLRLESIAEQASGGRASSSASPSTGERILWRVSSSSFYIQPILQKRTGRAWSKGRALALKHLMADSDQLARLDEEDRRVAKHVTVERRFEYGYPRTHYELSPRAWHALVGHPRVFLGDDEQPIAVVRGEPRLRLRATKAGFDLVTDPKELRPGLQIKQTKDQLVVYDVDGPLADVVEAVGRGIVLPPEAKERAVRLIEHLAPVVPVESSETTDAETIAPNAVPTVRIRVIDNHFGLSVLVRPLGRGSLVTPGEGSRTLVGHLDGRAVQTTRDLSQERALAKRIEEALADHCDLESGTFGWRARSPQACLEVIARLKELGDGVIVEWPEGEPLRLKGKLTLSSLRGKLTTKADFLHLAGTLEVEGGDAIALSDLLRSLGEQGERFVELGSGEFIELESNLHALCSRLAIHAPTKSKEGTIPLPRSSIGMLDELAELDGVRLDRATTAWREEILRAFALEPRVPKALQAELRDYQIEGYRWLSRLAAAGLGACLADDMGLGKTVQIIALLVQLASKGPSCVIAPTSVCDNWRREIERFAPTLRPRLYAGPDREGLLEVAGRGHVLIASYALLQQESEAFAAVKWNVAVLDEAQLIKNDKTQRAQAAFALSARARIAATGTPVENHEGDLFSIFRFLNPGLLGSFKHFSAQMADPAARRHLRRQLSPFILRRTKAQVLDDLPPLTEIQHDVELSTEEARLYSDLRARALAKLEAVGTKGKARIQIFAELTKLRRLCCHPSLAVPNSSLPGAKLQAFRELVGEIVEAGHRVLVFSQFTDVLALAKPILDELTIAYQYLDGSTPPKKRAAAVDAFQAGEGEVFLISLRAGGFGLNLTGADYVIHLDPWWNPAVESQASDRAHRIGQERPVTVYRLVAKETIEERIVELHREKRDLADAVLADTDGAARLSAEDLRALLS